MKQLAYYVIGGANRDYVRMLELGIKSLLRFKPDCDLLVICDASWEPTLAGVKQIAQDAGYPLYIYICEHNTDHVCSSMRKVEIFDWDRIQEYDTVLYLDCDLVISRDPMQLFAQIGSSDKLCVCSESTVSGHTLKTFSLSDYTREDLAFLRGNQIRPFNCGQFGFSTRNYDFRPHFTEIKELIKEYKASKKPYFYEQSFMNKHFNLRNMTDNGAVFNTHTKLFAFSYDAHIMIHHACGGHFDKKFNACKLIYAKSAPLVSLDSRMEIHKLVRSVPTCRIGTTGPLNAEFVTYLGTVATELHLGEETAENAKIGFTGTLHKGLATWAASSFDAVYIDVDLDTNMLELAFRAVKCMGWILGRKHDTPVVAEFCKSHGLKLSLATKDDTNTFGIIVVK